MLAYKVCEENLPLITVNNDGVTPKIEDEVTYFIMDPPYGSNLIVTEKVFEAEYIIRMPTNDALGRYLIDEK